MGFTLNIPAKLDFAAGAEVVKSLDSLSGYDRVTLDFSRLEWVEPFPMLHVVSAVQRAISRCTDTKFGGKGFRHQYATYMGFFRELGSKVGPREGEISNRENYLPIRMLDLAAARAEAGEKGVAVGRIIERLSGEIAQTLARQNHGRLWQNLQYALREIIRNAAEHSGSDRMYYCGQYWPERAQVEIALLDDGVGIANSLSRNPYLKATNSLEALRLSVLPGVSGTSFEGSQQSPDDEWGNSGFGLYVVSELCRRGGDFTMVSGDAALRLAGTSYSNLDVAHRGTAVRLVIDTDNLRSIAASLALIVAKGERIARDVLRLKFVEASTASKLGWFR